MVLPLGLIVVGFGISLIQAFLEKRAQDSAQAYKDKMTLWWMAFDKVRVRMQSNEGIDCETEVYSVHGCLLPFLTPSDLDVRMGPEN